MTQKASDGSGVTQPVARTCFVIMPFATAKGYEDGHSTQVYEHLFKPACKLAGFEAKRADEAETSNLIMMDVLNGIVSSDLVLCDLSSRNPNVMYELGICHAFNRPVTIVVDEKTDKTFDVAGLQKRSTTTVCRYGTWRRSKRESPEP